MNNNNNMPAPPDRFAYITLLAGNRVPPLLCVHPKPSGSGRGPGPKPPFWVPVATAHFIARSAATSRGVELSCFVWRHLEFCARHNLS